METVNEYIAEEGIEDIIKFLSTVDTEPYHEFAEENDVIDMDDWFEFGWFLNDQLGSLRHGVIPLVPFNYVRIEEEAERVVEEQNPIEYGDLVEIVSESVESATPEQVSDWLEFATYEDDENRNILDINFK